MTRSTDKPDVPRSCSDVFRFWVSVGLGLLVATVFQIVVIALQITGARAEPTDEQFNLEFGFGARARIACLFPVRSSRVGAKGAGKAVAKVACQ